MKKTAIGAWLALVGTSCGGIAIVDPDDGAGGTSTTTSGGGEDPLCVAACNALEPCGVEPASCISRCSQVTPGCEELREPFLTCLGNQVASSCSMAACDEETEDFLTCLNVSASGGSCGAASNSCACLHDDAFGNTYDYQCFGTNNLNCTCSLNGTELGKCTDNFQPCSFKKSCCAAIVFVRGFP